MTDRPPPPRILNRKVRYNFDLLETIEAGIALLGTEVKSVRAGRASLEEAYAHFRGIELYLIGCNIQPYTHAGPSFQHDPTRPRKLLLHRRELRKWAAKVTQKSLTIVPVEMHFNERGTLKIELALARGKTHGDKRDTIRQRDERRDIDRELRRRR